MSFEEKVLELTDLLAEAFSQERAALNIDVAEVVRQIKALLKVLVFRQNKRKIAVDGVTLDQIWAQIADYNQDCLRSLNKPLSSLLTSDMVKQESTEEEEEKEESSQDEELQPEEEDEQEEEEEEEEEQSDQEVQESAEFEEEEQEQQKELLDFSEDDDPEEEGQQQFEEQNLKYKDMYRSKKELKEEEAREKEVFEQARGDAYLNDEMVTEIEQIEAKMLKDKDWQLKGQIRAKQRPMNSLLAEHLDFAVIARNIPSSEQTKQRNNTIQDMIKRRIKESLFDDPIHKFAGLDELDKEGRSEMKFEKAEKGLGEEYANFLQKQALGGADPLESQHIEKVHEEIDNLQRQLFSVLDQMSQTHYVKIQKPKQEMKVEKIPALQIEEKIPFVVSIDNRALPGELLDPKKEVALVGKEERQRGTQHKHKKRVIRAKIKAKKNQEKAARRMFEGAALAKFQARLKYEQEKKSQKSGEGSNEKTKHGRLKSVEFFKSMENIAKEDIEKKQNRREKETKSGKTSKQFKL